ncbi:MAG: M20 family metallopeptidase [Carnobacterium sp.]|uniref:M20 family metallopeptidase n=1 Tax=unclassified Carnobacterium TaxID=257487 RepID=UPI00191450B2|nr:M20 family metallopeptidase [Carnobacterium sp. CS13]QQP70375.1 Sapep family Mn(2+)-dependent dipeptidase [Carnobacterium sp. CS13]
METWVTEKHQKESLAALKRLIDIPSVNTADGTSFPPFGKAIEDCLTEALVICEALGMTTYHDPAGFYGYADYGEGEELIAILCHLDVVPAGDLALWETDPFQAVVKDGVMYGRGSQDDKGPTIAALYAFKAVVDAGFTFNKRIRFVFGTDEETLWRCMAHYNLKEEQPTKGFVPDSAFPVTYAEKGLLQAKLVGPGSSAFALDCGDAFNVVPGNAQYQGQDAQQVSQKLVELDISQTLANQTVTVSGKAVHASAAGQGINAINQLATGLVQVHPHPILQFLAEKVGAETNGFRIFGEVKDEMTGELTFNVATIKVDETKSEIELDLRIPVSYPAADLAAILEKTAAAYGLTYEEFDHVPALYVPKESDLVQTLMAIYQNKTGDKAQPLTSGGATYARTMKNMVAFGAHFPNTKSLAHQANEGIVLAELFQAMDIYAETIVQLCCEEE